MNESRKKRIKTISIILSILMMQCAAQPAMPSAYVNDSSVSSSAEKAAVVIDLQEVVAEGKTGATVTVSFGNTYSELTRIATAGILVNGTRLNYNSNYSYISSANSGDCIVSGNTIQFYTSSLNEGENTVVFANPDGGRDVSVKLKMTKTEGDGWFTWDSYTIERLADSQEDENHQDETFGMNLKSISTDEYYTGYTIATFDHEYTDVVRIAQAGVRINDTDLHYNSSYSSLSYVSDDHDFIVTGNTIQFKTKLLNEGENTVVFMDPDGDNDVFVKLKMTKTEVPPKYWYENTSYEYAVEIIEDSIPEETTEVPTDEEHQLYVRLVGSFNHKITRQQDDVDAVSSATTGGSAYIASSSTAQVQYALVSRGTEPSDEDWQKPDYFKNGDQLLVDGAASKIIISPECEGVYGEINPFSGDIFLRGVPQQAGRFQVSVYLVTNKGNVTSNALSFRVYSGEEKLIDQLTYDNCIKTADGKYMFDNEPWYMANFGGENETVTVPEKIKAWYGSHAVLPEVNYGEIGRVAPRTDEGKPAQPTQTLILPEGCNLTMVNMKIHSDVKIVVQKGAKLTLRQTTVDGIIEVEDGGTFSMDYNDYGGGEWQHGSMINGQLRMKDGSVLENARITAHGNYLAECDNDTRQNFDPVVVTEGDVTIKGDVYIHGEEAPSGETGQPALKVTGTLHVPEGSTLACYGGGESFLTANGGTAIILDHGMISGDGNVIAIGGYGMNITGDTDKGRGGAAVSGNGSIAVKNVYLEGGATFHDNTTPAIDGSVKFADTTNRCIVEGTCNTTDKSEFYWFGTGDANGIIPQVEKTIAQNPQNANCSVKSEEPTEITTEATTTSTKMTESTSSETTTTSATSSTSATSTEQLKKATETNEATTASTNKTESTSSETTTTSATSPTSTTSTEQSKKTAVTTEATTASTKKTESTSSETAITATTSSTSTTSTVQSKETAVATEATTASTKKTESTSSESVTTTTTSTTSTEQLKKTTVATEATTASTNKTESASSETVTPKAAVTDYAIGDVNCDGEISISDVILLQKWLLTGSNVSLPCWKTADLNHDNAIDIFDLGLLKNMILND
jgi:hypothetical protein